MASPDAILADFRGRPGRTLGIRAQFATLPPLVIAAAEGLDFIYLDRQHGTATLEDVWNVVTGLAVFDIAVLVRVADQAPGEIGAVLEHARASGLPPAEFAARHAWLCNVGGAIGSGMPNAIGAAVAAPERKVICLTGDGSAMYTVQSLWTMARENLDVLTIVCANRAYRILEIEMARAGAPLGPATAGLLSLKEPVIDWVKLAEAQGVPAIRCETSEAFDAALAELLATPGPKLIEAVM